MANICKELKYKMIREVFQFMLDGSKRTKDILAYFSEKWTDPDYTKWTKETKQETKDRTINNYIADVKEYYFTYTDQEKDFEKNRTLSRLDNLYTRCVKIQDWKAAILVLKEIKDIVGFAGVQKTEINITDLSNITPLSFVKTKKTDE